MDANTIQPLAGVYGVCLLYLLFSDNRVILKLPLSYTMLCKMKLRLENKCTAYSQANRMGLNF